MLTLEDLLARRDRIAVVGLGYVGLPLTVALAKHFAVTGFDIDASRVAELRDGKDRTMEVTPSELAATDIAYTHDEADLAQCRMIIVAVPTPIDQYRIPDLGPLRLATAAVGRQMQPGTCVVYESTVYPGATEEVCVPILSEKSGLKYGTDFTVGYSPERINPGDRKHTIDSIIKVVSGSDASTTALLEGMYGQVVSAGIHLVSGIKVAEAAKVIENTQRDLNIALMNELAKIFDCMGIDTTEVLAAAGTKWNFLPFRPGLVGGHCIGVDPYYLTFKAEALGYHPEMILAGRRINDNMGKYVAERTVKLLISGNHSVRDSKVAILGLTFKEDVPDLRNTRVIDIIDELTDYGINVVVNDPLADPEEARTFYGADIVGLDDIEAVDAVILAVAHREYRDMGLDRIVRLCRPEHPVVVDIKSLFSSADAAAKGITYWRL